MSFGRMVSTWVYRPMTTNHPGEQDTPTRSLWKGPVAPLEALYYYGLKQGNETME